MMYSLGLSLNIFSFFPFCGTKIKEELLSFFLYLYFLSYITLQPKSKDIIMGEVSVSVWVSCNITSTPNHL